MTGIGARTLVAEMEIGYVAPVLRRDLVEGWWRRDGEKDLGALREYLSEWIHTTLEAVNPEAILVALLPALDQCRRQAEFNVRDLIFAADACFATDPPDSAQLRRVTIGAVDRLQTARDDIRKVSSALALITRADDVLEDLQAAIQAFIKDRDTTPEAFGKTAVERERFTDVVLADLLPYRRRLATLKAELVELDDQYSSTRRDIDRAMATIKLFNELGQMDVKMGQRQMSPGIPQFVPGKVTTRFPTRADG